MAAKKPTPAAPAKKSTAVARPKMSLPANYEEQQQADLDAFKSRLAVADSNKISVTQDKHFQLPSKDGDSAKVSAISGIIIDFCAHKRWYEMEFDRNNPTPPNCFALGFQPHDNLIPANNSPEVQAEDCKSCAKNKFVQRPNGTWAPKDCKDTYVLALIAPDDEGDGKMMTLSISSTAIREFDKYVRNLASAGKAPYNVITEFTFDSKSEYPSVRCNNIGAVPKDGVAFALSLREDAVKMVSAEPMVDGFEEKVVAKRLPPPKVKGRKAA